MITLNRIQEIDNPSRQIKEWGERLVASYLLEVYFESERLEFVWVIAGGESDAVQTEYDDDFDDFLILIGKGKPFRRINKLVNEVQEKFLLAVHFAYTGDKSIESKLPITVFQ